jgi:hypothetical protein
MAGAPVSSWSSSTVLSPPPLFRFSRAPGRLDPAVLVRTLLSPIVAGSCELAAVPRRRSSACLFAADCDRLCPSFLRQRVRIAVGKHGVVPPSPESPPSASKRRPVVCSPPGRLTGGVGLNPGTRCLSLCVELVCTYHFPRLILKRISEMVFQNLVNACLFHNSKNNAPNWLKQILLDSLRIDLLCKIFYDKFVILLYMVLFNSYNCCFPRKCIINHRELRKI